MLKIGKEFRFLDAVGYEYYLEKLKLPNSGLIFMPVLLTCVF